MNCLIYDFKSLNVNRIGLSSFRSDDHPYSCEVLTQKITQAVHPLRGYTLFPLFA